MAKVGDNAVTQGIRGKIENIIFRLMPNGETWANRNYNQVFLILLLTLPGLRHRIPLNTIKKTLTRTSTLQSDFQRAWQAWSLDHDGVSKAKAQKPNGPPS